MKTHDWQAITLEQMSPSFARKVIHTERMTIARVYLAKGSVVPRHQHPNEQVTVMQTGKLKFVFDEGEVIVSAGQVLEIPGGQPHSAVALEDSEAFDLFAPVREDWLRGDDSYLRGSAPTER